MVHIKKSKLDNLISHPRSHGKTTEFKHKVSKLIAEGKDVIHIGYDMAGDDPVILSKNENDKHMLWYNEYMQNPEPYVWQKEAMRNMKEPKKEENLYYKLTDHLSLSYHNKKTNIMIDDQDFLTCQYLILNIPDNETHEYDHIESIDHLLEKTGREEKHTYKEKMVSKKELFWGHCSNFQAWVEHDYDTRIIDSRLAFPILKRLGQLGDVKAKKVFKEELVQRLIEGHNKIFMAIRGLGYLHDFSIEELKTLYYDMKQKYAKRLEHSLYQDDMLFEFKRFIRYKERVEREKEEYEERKRQEKLRQERLNEMWARQAYNVKMNKLKKQKSILNWVYDDVKMVAPKLYKNKRWLNQMLIRHNITQIAKRCGVSHGTIKYWMKKNNLPKKGLKSI